MPKLSLNKDRSAAPFMSDSMSLVVGLNPLGMRTASERLFAALLPGLNVVTYRIRYYSFYCWVMKTFYEGRVDGKVSDLREEFREHLRESELLMAIINAHHGGSLSIPGIDRAVSILERAGDLLDFSMDVMPNGDDPGYLSEVMGGYAAYAASLETMHIILPLEDESKMYNITSSCPGRVSGQDLAKAFEDAVGAECISMFLTCAKERRITRNQLALLSDRFFAMRLNDSIERDMLEAMLLSGDRPGLQDKDCTWLRKGTIRLFLEYMRSGGMNSFSELEFARYAYGQFKSGADTSFSATGWYAYYLNDNRQYQALVIFSEVLERLKKSTSPGKWENISEFTASLAQEVCTELSAVGLTVGELISQWDSLQDTDSKMANAFRAILDDYICNRDHTETERIRKAVFPDVENDALHSFSVLDEHLDDLFSRFVQNFLAEEIIYGHYAESLRKLGQGGRPALKLMVENGYVRGLCGYTPSHSSPRIGILYGFANDLGWVNGCTLKDKGERILREEYKA